MTEDCRGILVKEDESHDTKEMDVEWDDSYTKILSTKLDIGETDDFGRDDSFLGGDDFGLSYTDSFDDGSLF